MNVYDGVFAAPIPLDVLTAITALDDCEMLPSLATTPIAATPDVGTLEN
jgi:hypothetical protein